jgi:hypothetical protein
VYVEPEDQPAVERLARYIMRPPISLGRMEWDGVGEVRYRRKGGHESFGPRQREVETFDPAEFIARVILHIPEPLRCQALGSWEVASSLAFASSSQRRRQALVEFLELGCKLIVFQSLAYAFSDPPTHNIRVLFQDRSHCPSLLAPPFDAERYDQASLTGGVAIPCS